MKHLYFQYICILTIHVVAQLFYKIIVSSNYWNLLNSG